MSKSITVKFDDGTSHVYDDVPDNVTDSEVEQRATEEFGKEVKGINLPTEAETAKQNFENQGMGERALGAVAAGANLAGQALSHPISMAAEGIVGGKYALNRIVEAIKNKGTPGPVAPQQAAQMGGAPQQAVNGIPNLSVQQGGAVAPGSQAFENMGQQLSKGGATSTMAAAKALPPQMSAAASIVQKLALDKVLKGAGIATGAYQLGQGLFGTSPEEIAIMKESEARKRAQGWKPLNER